MALEKTKFNAYMQPKYVYLRELLINDHMDSLKAQLFQLYQLLIKNGAPDKKKQMLTNLKATLLQL